MKVGVTLKVGVLVRVIVFEYDTGLIDDVTDGLGELV
jgi:hypothetical protein